MRPGSADEVRAAVEAAREARRPLVAVGGGTLVDVADAGAAADRIEMAGLSGVTAYDPEDLTVTCLAGTTLGALAEVLGEAGQVLPVHHPAPGRATVGGLISFGWTGLGRRLYGTLRDRVLEVRAVTGEARLVRGGGRVVKNVTGFDLPRLVCGSLGTLAIVVEVTLKVHPRPRPLIGGLRSGTGPADVALALAAGAERARQDMEAVLCRRDGAWEGYVFAPGPLPDADALLACVEGVRPLPDAEMAFDRLGADPVLCPDAQTAGVVVRAAVPPARVLELAPLLTAAERAVLDVASGVGWIGYDDPSMIAPVRAFCEGAAGSLVILHAPDDVRRTLGTWGGPPSGIEIMRRLKAQFDPDGVLAPGRFVV